MGSQIVDGFYTTVNCLYCTFGLQRKENSFRIVFEILGSQIGFNLERCFNKTVRPL